MIADAWRDQQGLRRVHHVIGSQAVVEPARMRADDFRHRGSKCDHVVAHLGLNFLDALQVEVGALANGFGRVFRHNAGLGEGLGRRDLNRQPGAKAVFIAPDAAHFRAGIAWNHLSHLSSAD